MRGDGRTPTKWESAVNQRKALDALAGTLKPSELTIPKKLLDLIPPRPPGFGIHRELFPRNTGEGFDPINPGAIAADVTIGFVLQPDRAARMVAQHAVDPTLPGLEEVIDRLTQGDLRRADRLALRGRSAPRRGAGAGRSAVVAGGRGPEQPGARDRVAQAAAAGHAAARERRQGRCRHRAAHAARRRRHQAVPRAARAKRRKMPTPTSRSTRCSPPTSSDSATSGRTASAAAARRLLGQPIGDTGLLLAVVGRPLGSWDEANPGQWLFHRRRSRPRPERGGTWSPTSSS